LAARFFHYSERDLVMDGQSVWPLDLSSLDLSKKKRMYAFIGLEGAGRSVIPNSSSRPRFIYSKLFSSLFMII
jgi:hypothetical protein